MSKEYLVSITQFCNQHQVEIEFINTLQRYGLIEIITTNSKEYYLHQEELPKLEKIVLLHQDLDINLEGVEVIMRLLRQVEEIQNEVITLKNRLRLYED
ncbi:chaperone modulator CbpM [Aquimarina brevivitae]|uniref:MerR-like DNA binding protein n=1 Tax=Aquimarina brevivitae TaxID=323412 RepID=A0A4Q7PIN5_9FLAO|nr:chaperone modulator CbpM [Aquimarina brevivitae]RZS99680.1 MerR-like DNA binding protein [Aquimarina brevivitae]